MRTGRRGPGSGVRGERRVTVKICGLTREEDAREAIAAGADYLGFVFYPASRRCLAESDGDWIRRLDGPRKVGVFRDQAPELVRRMREAASLDLVQLHGDETPEACEALGGAGAVVKALAAVPGLDWGRVAAYAAVARVLFDTGSPTGGGTGQRFDWAWLDGRPPGLAFWVAGGLTPGNVGDAVRALRPAGDDVASGVEAAVGRKDPAKIRAFLAAVRAVERS